MGRWYGVAALLTALLACDVAKRPGGIDAAPSFDANAAPDADVDVDPTNPVDILFVIDNSGTMAEEQESLTSGLSAFLSELEIAFGGRPSMHIGVVTTDLGAGPYNIQNCLESGDDGLLQSAPRVATCQPPDGAFIRDVLTEENQRERNYPSGELLATFDCIASLGTDGCGFEHPLEAMRRALDGRHPENEGFRRPEAALAVIFVTDEDDCSAEDTGLFDTSQSALDSELGPLSSYRCFEFGVVCEPDSRTQIGPRANCAPREPSDYLYAVTGYVDFLRTLAPEERIAIGLLSGPPAPVSVTTSDEGNPELEPSCASATGEAFPAVRLHAFVEAFAHRAGGTICDEFRTPLQQTAQEIASIIP